MKKVTKLLSMALVLMMIVGMLGACGKKDEEGGKVVNIRCWNDEFLRRMKDHMPGYEVVDATTGKLDGYTIKWTIVDNQNNAYQNALDDALLKQSKAKADDKIDIFLVEADYAAKYVDADLTAGVLSIGLTEADLANQYQYTKDAVTDSKGVLKGVSWQACPAGLIYRSDIAKEVLGTDDPAEVQKAVADWSKFAETAAKMKDAGYYMVSGYDDAFRVFSNNVSSKWVVDGKLNIDANIMKWVEQTKDFTEKGYNNKTTLWSDDWSKGFFPDGNVFCYFGPAWFIDFSMKADAAGSIANAGGWKLTEGPQSFFWGGTWICAATGTDNADIVAKIMKSMTCDATVMEGIVKKDNDFANHKSAMEKLAATDYSSKVLGGQNPLSLFANSADGISLKNISTYDQGCNEEFQKAMKEYFDGNQTLDEALAAFKKAIKIKYPDITVE